jgi:hypothetical protein
LVGVLLCSCAGSSVAQDRAAYVSAEKAVTRDQQIVFAMDAAGATAISCFSTREAPTRTSSPQCSVAAVKAQALAKLTADEATLNAVAHRLAGDNQSP